MTPPDLSSTDLADRYGDPSPWRRWLLVGTTVLVATLSLGWLLWAALFHSTPTASSDLIGWEVVDQHRVTARVSVSVEGDPEEVGATCRLTAHAEDHTTVGELVWTPVDGQDVVPVRTERIATSVDLVGCTAQGQPRPR